MSDGMNPKALELQARTQKFAADVLIFCQRLPDKREMRRIIDQLLDSSGATDSNYRAACRGRSPREFIAKLGVAAEEADESKGWLELLVRAKQVPEADARPLIQEADELTAIFVKSRKTAEGRQQERERSERNHRQRRK
jgi:four helix bundle protein